MSSGCGDVLSLADLQTAKKHQIFEAEVITGKSGGVATGADIDYATNQVTGQTQKTLPAVLRDAGFRPASFTFETGGTLGVNDADLAVLWPGPSGDGNYYAWKGALPKTIPASSTPASTGGVGKTAWVAVSEAALRRDLALSTGAGLVGTSSGRTVQGEVDHFKIGYMTPDDFGAVGDGTTDDTTAITNAIVYCSSNNIPLRVPSKPYVYTGGTVTQNITIIGDKVPFYNASTNTMTSGSRIIGGMRFSGNQVVIENMGFKRPTGSPGDALVLSTDNAAGASARVRNVVAAGLAATDAFHACLVEGYDAAHISDVTGAYNLFGVAIKSRNVVAKGLITYSCDTGLIIKSDAEFSTAKNVVVTGHVNVGNGVCSQGVWLIATTAQMERILVSNLESTGSAINCRINGSTAGVVNDIVVNGVSYSGATYADFVIDGGASGKLYNVSLNGVSAVSSVKLAAVGFCEQLTVDGFYGSITNAAAVDTAFEVSSGVGLFVGSNIHLAVNYGPAFAGLTLGNSYANNRLSGVRAKVLGAGKPRPGYTEVTVSGAAQALTVGDSLFNSGAVFITTAAASSSYSSINVNDVIGQPVSPGFRLAIRNGSANTVVFNHNPGTGGIVNNANIAKNLGGGDIIEYTFDGTNWRQTPSIT